MKKLLLFMCMCLCLLQVSAQNKTITGKVTDDKGAPVSNASVTVRGTKIGTVTREDGTYSINVPPGTKALTFSVIGFADQTVNVENSSTVSVTLTTADKSLDEIVVTGYVNLKKKQSAVASSVVDSKNIENIAITNVNDILQGKATGLTVTSTSGQPGASSNIRVRGVGSISAGQSPIYVIDGIIIERGQFAIDISSGTTTSTFSQNSDILSSLNPNDIESVTVLKDAAAMALYGSRGGNGVIVITTKRGKAGASKVTATLQYGRVMPSFGKWKMMDAKETFDYERSVYAVNGFTPAQIAAQVPDSLLNKTFDWVDAAFKNGSTQSYDLSISGGNEKTKHALSLGYFDQDGTVIHSGFKRMTAILNLDHQVNSWLKVGTTFNTNFTNTLNADGGGYYSSPILSTLTNSPIRVYPYKPDGSLYTGTEPDYGGFTGDNFLYSTALNYTKLKQFRGLGKLYGEIKIMPWMTFKQNFGIDLIYVSSKSFFDPTTGNGIGATPDKSGEIIQSQNNAYTYTSQSSISGNFRLTDKRHEFNYLGLIEYQRFNMSSILADGLGIADGKLQQMANTGTPNAVGGTESEYAFMSYLAQAGYTFDGRYSLTASFRRDGSSRFGANNRYANFYAFGGSWNVIQESFMKGQNIFSDLRIRASYGTSGVADFANYAAQQLYSYGSNYGYGGSAGSGPSSPGNDFLTWEKNKQTDIGVEMGFFKNRLRATVDVFKRIGEDLLQNVPVSRTSGFTSAQKNIGSIENKGFEVSLNSINIKSPSGFTWTTDFNWSYVTNKVTKLYNDQPISNGSLGRTAVGYPLGSWFLPVWAGVDPANGDPLWYLADGKTTTNSYSVASRTENKKFLGTAIPKYTFGLNNEFSYKGFSFSFFLYAITGSIIYDQTNSYIDADGTRWHWGYSKEASQNFWTTPGQPADRPKPVPGGNKNSTSASSRWLEKNDYIRLRNVSLSYTIPSSAVSKLKIASAKIFVSGVNLVTITGYKGVDPEVSIGGNDVFKYPVNKSVTGGVIVSF